MSKKFFKEFNIDFSNNQLTINGKTIKIPTGILNLGINGSVSVNGDDVEFEGSELIEDYRIQLVVNGNVNNLECEGDVIVNGDVTGGIECEGDIEIHGTHCGKIECDGDINIQQS
jgi:hypothetical protein